MLLAPLQSLAAGVGHNGTSVSLMRGVDAASWKYNRPCFVALALQVSQHSVECHVDDSSNIFANNPSRLDFLNNSEHLWPEVTVILTASALPGHTERLARESTGNNVNCS